MKNVTLMLLTSIITWLTLDLINPPKPVIKTSYIDTLIDSGLVEYHFDKTTNTLSLYDCRTNEYRK